MGRYSDDPEWADVPKIAQDDGPNPIVKIMYSDKFTDIMDCFRGVLQLNELSERTFQLTYDVIDANPANYTAWYFRRKVLEAIHGDLHAELEYIERMALEHPKNYQIWHHRREICILLQDGNREKEFSAHAIEDDSKNYHAWAHRQWAIRTFSLWDHELDYIDHMLTQDVRNNSAWNHRYFIIKHTTDLNLDIRRQEIIYTLEKIQTTVHNESPWNYLRGMIHGPYEQELFIMVKPSCLDILTQYPTCIFAAALLIDIYIKEGSKQGREIAKEWMDKLMNELDCVRAAYWQLRKSTLKET